MSAKASLITLDQPKAGRLNIAYAPDGTALTENPPRFTWLPVIEEEARYVIRISTSRTFKDAIEFSDIPLNFFTPDAPLAAGEYYWSYAVWDAKPVSEWSETRSFTVTKDLPQTPLPSRAARFQGNDSAHPRLWLGPKQLKAFASAVKKDPSHWIRHLAIGGHVLGDKAMLERSKEWLLEAASWNPAGTTSRSYTDEWAFRVNDALAWGYDWLYNELSEEERLIVRKALLARTRETADHIIKNAKIHLFPYDSHAVRAVSAVLIPACIAMLEDEPDAQEWLDYSIEFLSTVYSPWGDAEGGWAEGPHYWMTGMAYLIEAANLLKSYTGIDLYQRPFFQNTGDFPRSRPPTFQSSIGSKASVGPRSSTRCTIQMSRSRSS